MTQLDSMTKRTKTFRFGAAALATAALLAVAGCGGGDDADAAPSATPLPADVQSQLANISGIGQDISTIITATGSSVDVFLAPGETQPTSQFAAPNEHGAPRVFLATAKMPGWWQVLLPVQPNGTTGWVREDQVAATTTGLRIEVYREAHRLRLYDGETVLMDEPVGIGTTDTPTPGGRFYLMELLQPSNPNGPYGPYAFGLNGFSTSLDSFGGNDPVIGLHGTNQPELIGQDVSNGCIRLSNDAITRLAQTLPLGTPVEIHA
jgi:lipoprotein-anchoring transpeptidase ErfK/SrfK